VTSPEDAGLVEWAIDRIRPRGSHREGDADRGRHDVPLPTQLQELLSESKTEMVALSPDQLLQLKAYLAAPDRLHYAVSKLQEEDRRGIRTTRDLLARHREFHVYLKRVLTYNELLLASEPKGSKKPTGRQSDTDHIEDRRIYDAWKNSGERTLKAFCSTRGYKVRDIQLAIGRVNKRIAAKEEMASSKS
jgi:hypothetical protein